jgi:putative cardiolipin synthase
MKSHSKLNAIYWALFLSISTSGIPDSPSANASEVRAFGTTQIAVIESGQDALGLRLQAIAQARHSIRMQSLIFRGDESGLAIAKLLKQKKKEGLDVRVIVDMLSNGDVQTKLMYYDLALNNVAVEGWAPGPTELLNDVTLRSPGRINMRFHDKLLIIDGETSDAFGILGGMNIGNEYFQVDPAPKKQWRDQDLAIRGAAIEDMRQAFERNYADSKRIKKSNGWFFNTDGIWSTLVKLGIKRWGNWHIKPRQNSKIRANVWATLTRPIPLAWYPAASVFLQSRPRYGEAEVIHRQYLAQIENAKSEIVIENAYFIPPREILEALKRAARRGVQVIVITNSPQTNDTPLASEASRSDFPEALSVNAESETRSNGGSLQIFEYQGHLHGRGTIHSKYAIFDRARAIVGSYNMDPRSRDLNSETVLLFNGESVRHLLRKTFAEDLAISKPISLAEAQRSQRPKNFWNQARNWLAGRLKGWL